MFSYFVSLGSKSQVNIPKKILSGTLIFLPIGSIKYPGIVLACKDQKQRHYFIRHFYMEKTTKGDPG